MQLLHGEPVIFLACILAIAKSMTDCLGFPAAFIAAITKYSLTPGYERRRTLYNLYHPQSLQLIRRWLLQANRMIEQILEQELPYDEIIDPTDTYLLPEELWPDISHLVTEDDLPQEKQQRLLTAL